MSKEQIAIIALVLRGNKPHTGDYYMYYLAQWGDTVFAFAKVLESEYPDAFNRADFLKACGYDEGWL